VRPEEVGAMVAFLAGPSHFSLDELEDALGGAAPLEEALRGALGRAETSPGEGEAPE